jgi:hypothetical protein
VSMFRLYWLLCFGNVPVLFIALVQHVVPLHLQWQLAQLFPASFAGSACHCSVYLSLMSMDVTVYRIVSITQGCQGKYSTLRSMEQYCHCLRWFCKTNFANACDPLRKCIANFIQKGEHFCIAHSKGIWHRQQLIDGLLIGTTCLHCFGLIWPPATT